MGSLSQIIAVEKGIKSKAASAISEIYKLVQKPVLFSGFTKDYQPNAEDGEVFPPERQRVQYEVADVLKTLRNSASELIQITARKDWTNCVAVGSVVLDGKVIIKDAPVSFLLFLEKQLTDYRTFFSNLPVLDDAEDWKVDPNSGLFKTEPVSTNKSKKTQRAIVLYPATPEHPAQTQLITEDVNVGSWNQVKHSGAIPKPTKIKLVEKVDALLIAVKQAREGANIQEEVPVANISDAVFDFLLG